MVLTSACLCFGWNWSIICIFSYIHFLFLYDQFFLSIYSSFWHAASNIYLLIYHTQHCKNYRRSCLPFFLKYDLFWSGSTFATTNLIAVRLLWTDNFLNQTLVFLTFIVAYFCLVQFYWVDSMSLNTFNLSYWKFS